MSKRSVAYLRVSSASQIDNTSIEMQEDKIKQYCNLYDIEIAKIFIDEGLSAKGTDKRTEYNNMINYISEPNNNINMLIVYKADRVHRSLKNLMIMIEYLQEINVSFLSITEQFDTTTAQGLLFLQMLGSFSEFERKLIAERTHNGRISKGEKELYAGGRVPFGYKLIDNDILEVNKEEAKIIKDIFKMRCKGATIIEIGKKYNMSKQRISYILKNKIYIGKYEYNGKVEKNKISFIVPSIVSTYLYNKANSIS